MEIKTNFSVGEIAFFMCNNYIASAEIEKVSWSATKENGEVTTVAQYMLHFGTTHWLTDSKLFKTKQDLLNSL